MRPYSLCRQANISPGRDPFDEEVVDEAIPPALPGFEGTHHGVSASLVVLRRVTVRRGITAADVTAYKTLAKVHPAAPHVEALLTHSCGGCDVIGAVEVPASLAHRAACSGCDGTSASSSIAATNASKS